MVICPHYFLISVQLLSCVQLFATPRTAAYQAFLSITNSQRLLKLMSIESVMLSNHIIICDPLLLWPLIIPSIRVFSKSQFFTSGGQSIGISASASVLPTNPRTDLFQDGLVGSPCSPRDLQEFPPTPQFKSINSSALSLLYSPTFTSIHDHWKNHSLTRWTFVGKVISLLSNMLSKLVITFIPRSKHLLISWLQ